MLKPSLIADTKPFNRYNIIESTATSRARFKRPTLCFPPFMGRLYSSHRYRGGAPPSIQTDKTILIQASTKAKTMSPTLKGTIRQYCPLASTPAELLLGERDAYNNGGKRLLMTNLRFSFRYTSFSRILIILSILWGGYLLSACVSAGATRSVCIHYNTNWYTLYSY